MEGPSIAGRRRKRKKKATSWIEEERKKEGESLRRAAAEFEWRDVVGSILGYGCGVVVLTVGSFWPKLKSE